MSVRTSILSLSIAVLCVLQVAAQARSFSYDMRAYMAPLQDAERALAQVPVSAYARPRTAQARAAIDEAGGRLQKLGAERAFAGDTEGAIAAFDLLQDTPVRLGAGNEAQLARLADAQAEDAIRAIVAAARDKRVVLLNEAHHVPMHRAFAQRLAAELRRIGFTHLAAETFNDGAPGDARPLMPNGQTVAGTGTYTKDAVFAGFVNAALADGWKLVAYEPDWETLADKDPLQEVRKREQGQARNLVERIFSKDKEARVFIYAGYAHVYKAQPGDGIVWMAEYLERATKLELLSIDQTSFYAHPDRAAEAPLYAELSDRFRHQRTPFILRAADGSRPVLNGLAGRVDMQVIYPRYALQDGRAEWLRTLAGRSARPIPAALLPKEGRRIVKAFRADAVPDAVPLDVILVEAGRPAPNLMLPDGEFRYAVEDEAK